MARQRVIQPARVLHETRNIVNFAREQSGHELVVNQEQRVPIRVNSLAYVDFPAAILPHMK